MCTVALTRAPKAFVLSSAILLTVGCSSKKAGTDTGGLQSHDIYEISYGDGLLQEWLVLEDDTHDLERHDRGELAIPKAQITLSTAYNEQNVSYGSAHETRSPGLCVALMHKTTQRAARSAFDCEVVYKLSIVDWPSERLLEIPDDGCAGVRFLWLKNCVLDQAAVQKIGRLPSLEGLWLTLCKVSDGDLTLVTRPLRHRLKILSLFNSGFKDDAVSGINELRSVYVMGVFEPAITNGFFERLNAPLLRTLEVPGRGPPNRVLATQLRKERPALKILYGE